MPVILYIYAAVDSCSATFYYLKLQVYNWAKVGTVYWAAAVSRGIPRICRGEPQNLANGAAEFGKICRGKLWALVMMHR